MTAVSNAGADIAAADVRSHLHSQTDLGRYAETGPLTLVSGSGPYVFDIDGQRYLDGVASLWCASLGFSDDRLAAAAQRALGTLAVYHTFNARTNPSAAALSAAVADIAPFADARVFFTNSGSEANDSMVKMAWYAQVARGRPEKRKVIARMGGFHGATVLGARLSGLPLMHASFNLPDCHVVHTSRPHFYRDAEPGQSVEAFVARLGADLERLIEGEGPDTVAAFIAEPVMGAGGVIVPPAGYFQTIAPILKRHGILLLADEVICGFGRTGSWFGCQTFGFRPDMMSVAKGLSSGYMPIGGVIVSPELFEDIARESRRLGVFSHGFTYSGHPVSTAVAVEALRIYREMDLPAVAQRLGAHLMGRLEALRGHRLVGDVRGVGFVAGVELMADGAARLPFAPELKVGARVERQARRHGLILRNLGDVIAICPPYIVTERQIDWLVDRLRATLDDVAAELEKTELEKTGLESGEPEPAALAPAAGSAASA